LDIATGIGEPAVTAAEVIGDSSTTTTNGDSHVLATTLIQIITSHISTKIPNAYILYCSYCH